MVPRTSRSHHRLSIHSSSKLRQTFSHHFHKTSEISPFMLGDYPEISPEEECFLKRLPKGAISQRTSSVGVLVYEYKWKVFGEWCQSKQLDPDKTIVPQLSEFLTFLFEVKHLSVSSITGYRSCISKIFASRGINISHYEDLNMLVKSFYIEHPARRESPRWDLMVVLRHLLKTSL